MADIIVISVIIILMGLAIMKLISDKKKGIGSCGHVCSECASHGACSSSQPNEKYKEFLDKRRS